MMRRQLLKVYLTALSIPLAVSLAVSCTHSSSHDDDVPTRLDEAIHAANDVDTTNESIDGISEHSEHERSDLDTATSQLGELTKEEHSRILEELLSVRRETKVLTHIRERMSEELSQVKSQLATTQMDLGNALTASRDYYDANRILEKKLAELEDDLAASQAERERLEEANRQAVSERDEARKECSRLSKQLQEATP